jgi:anti-sigma B factor antagonist
VDFSIRDEPVGDHTQVVRAAGEIDLAVEGQLQEHLRGLMDRGVKYLIVDLAEVTFLDSSGIQALIAAQGRARTAGGDLVVASASDNVRKIFQITGVTEVFGLYATVDEAYARTAGRFPTVG